MDRTINAKQLRASLPRIVGRIRRGERFTVLYRSRPAFRMVPIEDLSSEASGLEDEPLYRARPVGTSSDGMSSRDHDKILYKSR
jgi:antitoxin (DNA-binding transcriptional repressor) of toxin-antitoxin stability system